MTPGPRYTVERLAWSDERLGSIPLPKAELHVTQSFGSGLSRRASDPPGQVWAVGDRGPNLKVKTMLERYGTEHLAPLASLEGAKVMPRLDVGPRIARLRVEKGGVTLVESFPVGGADGQALTGLPTPGGDHSASEPAFDLDGAPLAPDPSGLDTEGIAALADGSFILSDEFGPSLVRVGSDGRVLARHVPDGTRLDGARHPVHATLPAIAGRRQLNRGFEAVAVSADQKDLLLAFQSPLAHPDTAAHRAARHVRVWRVALATMQVTAQYLYPLDPPETFARDCAAGEFGWSDLKISEMAFLPGGSLIVLERGSHTTKIYRVDLNNADASPPEHLDLATRPTVEERSGGDKLDLPCLAKTLLFSSDDALEVGADLEGMAILSPTQLLLVNDNDFGVEGAETAFWKLRFAEPVLG